jgi:hypothetical protein
MEDGHACPTASVPTPSFMFYELAVIGKGLLRRNCVLLQRLMIAFKNGCRQEFFSNCGKQDRSNAEELEGIDWNWYAKKRARTKFPWGGRNTSTSPTSSGQRGRKRRRPSSRHEVPVALETEETKHPGMRTGATNPRCHRDGARLPDSR